jgi:hypothetical protein
MFVPRRGVPPGHEPARGWVRPEELLEDPEPIAIREALAFGKAVYDVRMARVWDGGIHP